MKKLSIITFILLFSVPAFSQFFSFGIKAGAETSTAPKYNVISSAVTSAYWNISAIENASWGFHGGIFTRIKIFFLYVQPEIVFASNSFDYNVSGQAFPLASTYTYYNRSQKFNKLSVPILVGMKFGPFRINAGPAANVQIGTPKALIDDPNFKEFYKDAVWELQAGIGIDIFKKLTIDARYAGNFGEKYGDAVMIGNQIFKLDRGQKSFLISLGLMF